MRGGYHQMIRELMATHSEKLMPWMVHATTTPILSSSFLTAGGNPIQPPHYPVPMIHAKEVVPEYDYLECKESDQEILFEYKGWVIEHYVGSPKTDCDWISHYCPTYGWRYRTDQWTLMADGVCAGCCQTIPEEIMGVWKLKNFDQLVGMETARDMQTPMLYDSSGHVDDDQFEDV
jgi:hypothetical protein